MRIKELDGLRGIAVLAVLDCHYLGWIRFSGAQYGLLGVDLFFVLSGFLISSILFDLRNKEHYFSIFYSRRALRIFPPYFLGLSIYIAISLLLGMPGKLSMWLSYIFYYSSLFRDLPTFLRDALLPMAVKLGLAVLWSLSVEELYYTFWAPVVRFTQEKWFVVILAGMVIMAPALRWFLHTDNYLEIFTIYCRMDGLAYGSAVALLVRHRRHSPEAWPRADRWFDRLCVVFLPISLIFWMVFGRNFGNRLACTVGISLANISFALIAFALIRKSGGNQFYIRVFRSKWLRSIGMVSYSLYLFHYPLLNLSTHLVERLHLSRRLNAVTLTLFGLAMSFAVAYALWYGMESRILRWKDRYVPSPAHP
jgi:peptidoglycan/LPS O-acetylase OafA/YrhL